MTAKVRTLYLRNLLLGGVLALGMHVLIPSGSYLILRLGNIAGDVLNNVVDWTARHGWYPTHHNVSGRLTPIIILNIDDEAYHLWGEPTMTPRDKLAKLVKFSLESGAAAVLVDVDLSWRGPVPEADAQLEKVVLDELRTARERQRPSKIILTKRVAGYLNRNQWIREIYFESSIEEQGLSIQAGTSTFLVDDDYVVRRWRLAKTTCKDNRGDAALSLQLLVAGIFFDAQDKLREVKQSFAENACKINLPPVASKALGNLPLREGFTISLDNKAMESRMRFKFDWADNRNGDLSTVAVGHAASTLLILPALLALGSSSEDAAKTFRSATVLIGNTHYDSNDLHATPLGEMPGILLLANAIYSLLDGGVMEEPHPAVLLFLELLVVLLLAAIFTWVNLRFTLLLGVVLVALLLFSTAILLFYFGVWFDFVTPLLGPITHQFLAKHSHTNESPAGETN